MTLEDISDRYKSPLKLFRKSNITEVHYYNPNIDRFMVYPTKTYSLSNNMKQNKHTSLWWKSRASNNIIDFTYSYYEEYPLEYDYTPLYDIELTSTRLQSYDNDSKYLSSIYSDYNNDDDNELYLIGYDELSMEWLKHNLNFATAVITHIYHKDDI